MNRNDSVCDDEQLLVLLRSDEHCEETRPVVSHVRQCDGCQQRLEELAASPDDWDEAGVLLAAHRLVTNDTREQRASRWSAPTLAARPVAWSESMAKPLLSPPTHPEMLGRVGRYDVERLIGSGGMGVVFKAHDTELNRPVAVKLLAPHLAASGSARHRFAREARAAAAVVDDHVVPIHNVETDDEHPFLVMKYIAGGSLQQRLDGEGPLDVCEVLRIGIQTAMGLAAAHAQGLIHRDVKPSNILLDEGVDRALLTDFGLARATDDASLTRSGFHPGTPHYMSPEQVRGEDIDARSDLFGLGCVLYALSTGHPPFRSETSYSVLRRITDDTPRPIRETNPDVPEWLERLVMKLLSKSPNDRFESAEQVAELLEDCLAHVQQPTTVLLPESVNQLSQRFAKETAASGHSSKPLGQWFYNRPPIIKLIAAAAFAFSLIFAGVLIVLELNKGTLTIESDGDDVPIRIMQGESVIDRMTLTKTPKSIRIAAGKYVVEIDGEVVGLSVKGSEVVLRRNANETVRIVRSDKSPDASLPGKERVSESTSSGLNANTTTGNLLSGTWEAELRTQDGPMRRGFAAFAGSSGMIASLDDQTGPMRFQYVISLHGREPQLWIDMQATDGADDGGPSLWQGIVEVHPENIVMCFAREDKVRQYGRPKSCEDADRSIFAHATLTRKRSVSPQVAKIKTEMEQATQEFVENFAASKKSARKSNEHRGGSLKPVDFVLGKTNLANGDQIEIQSVTTSGSGFEVGALVTVKGTYTLNSQDTATLGFFSTQLPGETPAPTPIQSSQQMNAKRGQHTFTLSKVIRRIGSPHVSFYHPTTGQGMGGVYFSEKDATVSKSLEKSQDDTNTQPVAFLLGKTNFVEGDQIEIQSVTTSGSGFEVGALVTVKGTYTLNSEDTATLGFFSTQLPGETPTPTPIQSGQQMNVKRGQHTFTLSKVIGRIGSPHVSFYHPTTGQGMGGVYFSDSSSTPPKIDKTLTSDGEVDSNGAD